MVTWSPRSKEKKTSQALKVPEEGDQIASPRGSKKKSSKSSEEVREDADQLASPTGTKKKSSKSSEEVKEGDTGDDRSTKRKKSKKPEEEVARPEKVNIIIPEEDRKEPLDRTVSRKAPKPEKQEAT